MDKFVSRVENSFICSFMSLDVVSGGSRELRTLEARVLLSALIGLSNDVFGRCCKTSTQKTSPRGGWMGPEPDPPMGRRSQTGGPGIGCGFQLEAPEFYFGNALRRQSGGSPKGGGVSARAGWLGEPEGLKEPVLCRRHTSPLHSPLG